MSRKPSIEGETYTESPLTYDEAQHFITITRSEYNELIHDSELLRCLKLNGVEDDGLPEVDLAEGAGLPEVMPVVSYEPEKWAWSWGVDSDA